MKRLMKLFLNLLLALVAVSLTMLVIFFMKPSWQKSLVEEALSRDTARKWQVGAVHILPNAVELENVYVLDGQIGAGIKYVQFSGPLWRLPVLGELDIQSGSVMGLDLDVSSVKVGDLTSSDYQGFLERVSSDLDFWEERIGLILSKLSALGMRVEIENVQIKGAVFMPGEKSIPLNLVIERADSESPETIKVSPYLRARTL